jgi:UDP-galactopyranose mutase
MQYDLIIVGAGFFGSVFAREATDNGLRVLIIEKRDHIGGNSFSAPDPETGIEVHRYGTHIFHTESDDVWTYINRFSSFTHYQHRVLTRTQGKVFSLPINLSTINAFFGVSLQPFEVAAFMATRITPIAAPSSLEEKAISLIGVELYEAFIKGYTLKQWGTDPRELPASIITRLPVRFSYDDRYFGDRHQGLPLNGYGALFEKMLSGIPVELGTNFLENKDYWRSRCTQLVYTGPIDEYFGYAHGHLGWRSVRFETERPGVGDYQGTSVMNYADQNVAYTRIHEPRHLHPERTYRPDVTVIMKEYSYVNPDERYYPVNTRNDKELLSRYEALSAEDKGVLFGGRLAEYKYYDMHHVIGSALHKSRAFLRSRHP